MLMLVGRRCAGVGARAADQGQPAAVAGCSAHPMHSARPRRRFKTVGSSGSLSTLRGKLANAGLPTSGPCPSSADEASGGLHRCCTARTKIRHTSQALKLSVSADPTAKADSDDRLMLQRTAWTRLRVLADAVESHAAESASQLPQPERSS